MAFRLTEAEYIALLARRKPVEPRAKYGNKKISIDGHLFHSKKEAMRYHALKLAQRAGLISNLELQVPFDLEVNGVHVCRYVADFRYTEKGKVVVEDVKGFRTQLYRLKKKLMLACKGIVIRET